jgi:hypothetical protein
MWSTMAAEKASWGPGPWNGEPDKEQWQDEAAGFACLIKRNRMGALCGYVGVPEGHPWHGSGYSPGYSTEGELSPALRLLDEVEIHGGLTYADSCQEGPEDKTICHVPAPGEPEPLWWFGFDCAHAGDVSPGLREVYAEAGIVRSASPFGETYRDVAYVKAECASLAQQAAEAVKVAATV